MSDKFKNISFMKLFALSCLFILLFWIIYLLIVLNIFPNSTERVGFGNMFGALSSLFAGFAIAGLLATLYLQQKQIRSQQKERDLQNLENRFFNLIGLQNKILEQIVIEDKKEIICRGKNTFKVIFDDIEYLYNIFSKKNEENWGDERLANLLTPKYVGRYWPDYFPEHEQDFKASFAIDMIMQKPFNSEEEKLKHVYYAVFHKYHTEVGHYFRHLYHILKFLNTKELEEVKNKQNKDTSYSKFKSYADILQAQMSSSEMLVLFFNGLCFNKMRKLVYHYKFLENLAKDFLIKEEHAEQYGGEEIDKIKYNRIVFKSLDALIK